MLAQTLPATDFARGLSDYLNQVQYRGQVFDISRGKKVIARLVPAGHQEGFPIAQLDAFLANAPHLMPGDAEQFLKDIAHLREDRIVVRDPWEDEAEETAQ